jgi:hypothetical protein
MSNFKIILKVCDRYIIANENKPKKVDEWVELYHQKPECTQMEVYQKNGQGYDLVCKEYKRTIGFTLPT